MAKDPAFLFYSSDFLVGIQDLTMEERGQYITLLCLNHQKGRLSPKSIQLACHGNAAADVLAKFRQDENGLYYNPRLEEEAEKRRAHGEKQREKASKRWGSDKNNATAYPTADATAYATAMPLEDENEIENTEVSKGGVGENWNQRPEPGDVPDLPDLKLQSAKEFLYYTRKLNVPPDTILGLFSVFRQQHLTGKKFYQTRDDVYSHFLNWIKNQPINDGTTTGKGNSKTAGLRSLMAKLQHESSVANVPGAGDIGG